MLDHDLSVSADETQEEVSPAGDTAGVAAKIKELVEDIDGVHIGSQHLVADEALSRGDWHRLITRLAPVSKGANWWLGDALAFGERQWGETYAEVARLANLSTKTLRNRAYVS